MQQAIAHGFWLLPDHYLHLLMYRVLSGATFLAFISKDRKRCEIVMANG
jgi:hypothetical protein